MKSYQTLSGTQKTQNLRDLNNCAELFLQDELNIKYRSN